MASKRFLISYLIVMLIGTVCSSSEAYNFYVGGKNGWVITPSENFNHWAERNRFQINDTLIFKYMKGKDSVLIVSKEDYDKCNTKNPMKSMDDGDSTLKIDRSGSFFFISGNPGSCEKGQKLHIIVLSVRPTPSSKQPSSPPPSVSPVSPAPGPDHGAHDNETTTAAPAPAPSSSPSLSSSKYSIVGVLVSSVLLLVSLLAW